MAKLLRLSLPVLIIILGILLSQYIKQNKPQAQKKTVQQQTKLAVEVSRLQPQDYQVWIASYGSIQAHTETKLIAQVAGTITNVSDNFREGEFFKKGEQLLKIDQRDYQNAITIAAAELQTTQLQLAEEQAKVVQALRDWQRLGKGKPANDLVLRKPQLAAKQAALASAQAKLSKAKLELERTVIRAPYAGRVIDKNVELGEYVSSGKQLASSYAIDYLELRLPLSLSDQAVLNIPENFRQSHSSISKPLVKLYTQLGTQQYQWRAQIERSEAALNSTSRQLYLVAKIDDPYGPNNENKPPLKIGQFVSANIQGKTLKQVYVIPRSALYPDQQVVILENGLLQRKKVSLIWQDPQSYIIDGGLNPGQTLVTTPLGRVISGTPARVIGD
ncbi:MULTISPECIES: efflux RND transporter periplasmic adaptor subunit [unclassified Agarivorans]|uniref:efflux RND transporter periplasmic adaptor subunit n=1 Tax=unclassified Agarivorans TaxID=2636026 RepID=UPI003D7EA857